MGIPDPSDADQPQASPHGDAIGAVPVAARMRRLDMAPTAHWAHLHWSGSASGARVHLDCPGDVFGQPPALPVTLEWTYTTYTATHGDDWDGYRLDLFGAFVAGPSDLDDAPYCQLALPSDDTGADGFLYWSHRGSEAPRPTAAQQVLWIRLWEQRASVGDTPLYAEITWHPTHGQVHGVRYPQGSTPSRADWGQAQRALAQLEDVAQFFTSRHRERLLTLRAVRHLLDAREAIPERSRWPLTAIEVAERIKSPEWTEPVNEKTVRRACNPPGWARIQREYSPPYRR